MDLREYMFRNRISNRKMAEILTCSVPSITLARYKTVGKNLARRIEKATDGQVKAWEVCQKIPMPTDPIEDDERAA